ncbi:MAG: sugar phosphate nucleotidyltransferase [Anaerolineales bacterium]
MRLVLPMAGLGTRLRPHTWSKPKPLVPVAGKTVLGHFLDPVIALPDLEEVVLIVGYLGDQIRGYMGQHYPNLRVRYVVQEELSGQSHAIWLAREGLEGPTLIGFVDTLIETDFNVSNGEAAIWVSEVDDPRRFGVVEADAEGRVQRLIEKPDDPPSNLAVVGFYYFERAERLIEAIQQQMERGSKLKGEYFLADAINVMLDGGLNMRAVQVGAWNDCGTQGAVLDTNRYLLDHGRDNTKIALAGNGVVIEPPVFLDPAAHVSRSVIGPHVSIGPGCVVMRSSIRGSILDANTEVRDSDLSDSLIGRACMILNSVGSLNIGDASQVRGGRGE